jgi:hypothetical protein
MKEIHFFHQSKSYFCDFTSFTQNIPKELHAFDTNEGKHQS